MAELRQLHLEERRFIRCKELLYACFEQGHSTACSIFQAFFFFFLEKKKIKNSEFFLVPSNVVIMVTASC